MAQPRSNVRLDYSIRKVTSINTVSRTARIWLETRQTKLSSVLCTVVFVFVHHHHIIILLPSSCYSLAPWLWSLVPVDLLDYFRRGFDLLEGREVVWVKSTMKAVNRDDNFYFDMTIFQVSFTSFIIIAILFTVFFTY